MFSNLKVAFRLGIGFAVLLVISLVIGGIALTRLAHLDEVVNRLSTQDWETARAAMENQIRTRDNVGKSLRILLADGDAETITRIRAEMEENSKANSDGHEAPRATGHRQGGPGSARRDGDRTRRLQRAARTRCWTLAKDPKTRDAAMKAYNDEVMPLLEKYLEQFRTLKDQTQARFAASADESRATYASARRTIISAGIAALVFGIALAILLARSIVKPLRNAVQIADAVKQGRLDNDIEPMARTRPASC